MSFPHNGRLFSRESYVSPNNHTGSCIKSRQAGACVELALFGNEVEPMQGAQVASCAKEQVSIEKKSQLESLYDIEVESKQIIHCGRYC